MGARSGLVQAVSERQCTRSNNGSDDTIKGIQMRPGDKSPGKITAQGECFHFARSLMTGYSIIVQIAFRPFAARGESARWRNQYSHGVLTAAGGNRVRFH